MSKTEQLPGGSFQIEPFRDPQVRGGVEHVLHDYHPYVILRAGADGHFQQHVHPRQQGVRVGVAVLYVPENQSNRKKVSIDHTRPCIQT